jgi:subtilisin family serine protease
VFDFVELDHHVQVNSGEAERQESGGVCQRRNVQDPLWSYQWGAQAIHSEAAWCHSTGTGVTVAVIDTGVDTNHPDLRASLWVNDAEAFGLEGVDDDGNGYVDDIHGYDFVSDRVSLSATLDQQPVLTRPYFHVLLSWMLICITVIMSC